VLGERAAKKKSRKSSTSAPLLGSRDTATPTRTTAKPERVLPKKPPSRRTPPQRAAGSSRGDHRPRGAEPRREPAALTVLPVSADNWADFVALFSARGSPHYCWCSVYRFRNNADLSRDEKRARMLGLVRAGAPVGVLAYRDGEPVGWCSVAPRETYVKLERSRTMPRVSPGPTWTILCFFVPRAQRGTGITRALLAGALAVAREHGAEVVEGYPHDTAGISATHRGSSRVFRELGFERQGSRWFYPLRPAKKGRVPARHKAR
jgi:GNAT superfamily N-acetyltransferase